jgi:hypothetical protein
MGPSSKNNPLVFKAPANFGNINLLTANGYTPKIYSHIKTSETPEAHNRSIDTVNSIDSSINDAFPLPV